MTGRKLYVEPEYQRIHALVFTIKTDKRNKDQFAPEEA